MKVKPVDLRAISFFASPSITKPWNNENFKGYNSAFARKFWEKLNYFDEVEIDTEIKEFNLEYEKYNNLIGINIDPEEIEDETLPEDFTLSEDL